MATYRKTSPAPSSLVAEPFADYTDARARADALGIPSRPLRRMTPDGLRWLVIRPGIPARPSFVRVADWHPSPRIPSDILGEVMARVRFDVDALQAPETAQQPRETIRPPGNGNRQQERPREPFKPAPGHVERIGRTSRHPSMQRRERETA